MAEKTLKARVINKHETQEDWEKATNFTPRQAEVIIYDADAEHPYARLKIGDGTTPVNDLPFIADRNKILDYITYTIESDNTVTITGCDTSISGSHIIPSTIEGYPVTTIGMNAFENCTGITSVIIPKGITSLYPSAFYGCSNLTSIEIPDTVNDMGYDVFSGCTKLKEVSFNAKITSLCGSTFADCTSLTSIVIPNGVIDIATDFYNCSSLKTITIPDSVTSIYEYAFYNCTSLTDVYYSGTQEQWNSIDIGGSNDSLLNATIHYNQKLATEEFVLNNSGSGGTVDQTYNPESENPQSGKAVAEAINGVVTKDGTTIDFNKPGVVRALLPQLVEADSIETLQTVILNPPENDIDGVNKKYVDDLITTKMDKFGEITQNETSTTIDNDGDLNLKSNNYLVFEGKNGLILKTGLMSINADYIDVLNARLITLAEPENASDAATKGYVDTAISNGIAESIGNINSVLATIVDGVE